MPITRANRRVHTPFSVRPTTGPKLGVCAYYAPGGTTTNLSQGMISDADRRARFRRIAAHPGALVVMNVASGPGTSANAVETRARAELNQAGVTVLGYVSTRDSGVKRPAADVKKDIDSWVALYDPDGIFLDEGEPAQTNADVAYYSDLAAYVRAKSRDLVVAYNPGTHPHADYYQVMDVIMICEHPAATVLDDAQVPDLDENRAGPAQVWAMAYQATADQARALVAKARRCGWHYLTILDTNPDTDWYQTLPPDAFLDLPALAAPAAAGGGTATVSPIAGEPGLYSIGA